jgi:hypothetical protein
MRVTVGFKVLVNLDSVEFINDEIYFSFYFFLLNTNIIFLL